ncbi:putative quinol monooxygenase [Howardella ureilytica]
MLMIKIVAEWFVKPESRDKFLELCEEIIEGTRAEAGNISYALHENISDRNHLTFIEEWKDQDAIDFHNNSEHFVKIVPQLKDLCSDEPRIILYTVNM